MNKIKSLRKKSRKTQSQIASILNITQQTLANYENCKTEAPQEIIKQLADYFEVSIDFLLDREFEQKVEPRASPLTEEEQNLIDNYKKLDTHKKMRVQGYIENMLEEEILQKDKTKWN